MYAQLPDTSRPALIGRSQELAAVCALVRQPEVRLVTLTGPPGIGKTCLALEVLTCLAADSRLIAVELAPLTEPGHVAGVIAQAFGLQATPDRSARETLLEHAHQHNGLLLLDNFEHVLEATPLVAALLDAAPQLSVLATSRTPLYLAHEHLFVVPPLERQHAAVQLFVERAQAVRAGFHLTPAYADDVVAICELLDGVPLAVELAAARIRLFEPRALLVRLRGDALLPTLSGGSLTASTYPRTLLDTLAWSVRLLKLEQRERFAALGVFVGGFSVEAVGAVWSVTNEAVIETLDMLMDASLVRRSVDAEGEPRFAMLETIRAYALERLAEHNRDAHQRHAAHYLALAEQAQPEVRGSQQVQWFARLTQEHDNFRAALRWAFGSGDGATALRLAAALGSFWYLRGHIAEGQEWLERALVTGAAAPIEARALALRELGEIRRVQSDSDRAQQLFEASLALYRAAGNARRAAGVLNLLGSLAFDCGAYAEALATLVECLELRRSLEDTQGTAWALIGVGTALLHLGQLADAEARYAESLALHRALRHTVGEGWSLLGIGRVEFARGRVEAASRLIEESLALMRSAGNTSGIAQSLHQLGELARTRGDLAAARAHLTESLKLMHELGRPSGAAEVLDGLGWVALASGDLSEAGSKLSESLVIRRRLGLRRIMAASLATTMRLVTKAHPALAAGLSKLVPMIEHATGSEWEAAVGEARAALAGLGTLSNTEPRSLTGRQRQVLQLAAQDLKNTAIATHLDISLGTVNLHLSEAYRRLGVSSRAAAVRVALERGLLADPPRTTKRGNRNQRKRKERGR